MDFEEIKKIMGERIYRNLLLSMSESGLIGCIGDEKSPQDLRTGGVTESSHG